MRARAVQRQGRARVVTEDAAGLPNHAGLELRALAHHHRVALVTPLTVERQIRDRQDALGVTRRAERRSRVDLGAHEVFPHAAADDLGHTEQRLPTLLAVQAHEPLIALLLEVHRVRTKVKRRSFERRTDLGVLDVPRHAMHG